VVRAGDRLYELAPLIFEQPTSQPKGWLDQIVGTFKVIAAQAAPPGRPRPT
jgi:hypothetical protein